MCLVICNKSESGDCKADDCAHHGVHEHREEDGCELKWCIEYSCLECVPMVDSEHIS